MAPKASSPTEQRGSAPQPAPFVPSSSAAQQSTPEDVEARKKRRILMTLLDAALPFSFGRQESTMMMFSMLNAPSACPAADELRAELDILHAVLVQQSLDVLRQAKAKFSLLYDQWKTELDVNLYVLIATYVDDDWRPRQVILDVHVVNSYSTNLALGAARIICTLKRTQLLDKWSGILSSDSTFYNMPVAQILERHFAPRFTLAKGLVLSLPHQLHVAGWYGFHAAGKHVVLHDKRLATKLTRRSLQYVDPLPRNATAEDRLLWNQTLALVDYDAHCEYYEKKDPAPMDELEAEADALCNTFKAALEEFRKQGSLPEEDLDYAELPARDEGEEALP